MRPAAASLTAAMYSMASLTGMNPRPAIRRITISPATRRASDAAASRVSGLADGTYPGIETSSRSASAFRGTTVFGFGPPSSNMANGPPTFSAMVRSLDRGGFDRSTSQSDTV